MQKFWNTDDALSATERAEAYGIDLSLIEDNLRLTPAERLARNDAILNEAESLRSAWLKTREKPDSHHSTTF